MASSRHPEQNKYFLGFVIDSRTIHTYERIDDLMVEDTTSTAPYTKSKHEHI
jgi:hypothetical protein